MHLIITLRAGAGVGLVCEFLELSGLATGMPPRAVTVCEDDTFHPDVCLVTIEPVSNFIVVEQYAPDRTAASWTQALNTALDGLPVTVIQGTSDEAKALRHQQEQDLGAPHASDLFHGQHEVSKGTSLHLARQVKQAAAAVAAAEASLAAARAAERAYHAQVPHPRGRAPAFAAGCADLFQRSSSRVEVRNGHLSLYHHGNQRLSDRKLAALTALHNFYVRRPEGTTAAERFFGRAHPALFEQVLAHVDLPPPAQRRRPRPVKRPALALAAA